MCFLHKEINQKGEGVGADQRKGWRESTLHEGRGCSAECLTVPLSAGTQGQFVERMKTKAVLGS